jgi:hypothetical protein
MKKNNTKNQLRDLIREVIKEEGHMKPDSATIKYKKSKDAKSATIDEPRKHDPTSATIKEKKGFSRDDLKNYVNLKGRKHNVLTVHVRGKELAIDGEDALIDRKYGMGLTKDGQEVEFKYSDIEFATVNGKRI